MPRTARSTEAGLIYQVLNRGNGRMCLFHKDAEFAACEHVLAEGLEGCSVELPMYRPMRTHWHCVLRPWKGRCW